MSIQVICLGIRGVRSPLRFCSFKIRFAVIGVFINFLLTAWHKPENAKVQTSQLLAFGAQTVWPNPTSKGLMAAQYFGGSQSCNSSLVCSEFFAFGDAHPHNLANR